MSYGLGTELLEPYRPSGSDSFDAVKAGHLLNRAGFGGTPEEVERVRAMGPHDAADWLLDFPDQTAEQQSQSDVPQFGDIEGYPKDFREIRMMLAGKSQEERKAFIQKLMMANREALQATMGWWLGRMANGPHPLQEKLTLFWHGHFTSSAKDEKAATLIWNQNELLRKNAAGNFRGFVKQISRDPAMLDYLNNDQNRKAHPNENYARELMELFTLGIGNYTEDDIKQSARAFTGWAHDGDDFVFRRFDHDYGDKYFMGRSGMFDGDDIIDIIMSQPACSTFIAGELFAFFAYEHAEPQVLTGLAENLREHEYDTRPMLKQMLTSRAFYSDRAIGTQIKSPVQLVVGTIRQLQVDMPDVRRLEGQLRQMGQVPLFPPNVKGWPGGELWINTSTLFERYNFAVALAGGAPAVSFRARVGVPTKDSNNFDPTVASSPRGTVDEWVGRLIQRPIDDSKRQILLAALGDDIDNPQRVKRMVQLLVSMPEYQLC